MSLFVLYSDVKHSDFIFKVIDKDEKIFDYFFPIDESPSKLDKIVLDDQGFFSSKKIEINDFFNNFDYFPNSIGIPIFSTKAYNIINNKVHGEIEFVECTVKNTDFKLYAAKAKKVYDIIEKRVGMNFIFKDKKLEFSYLGQDIDFTTFLFTDLFIEFITDNELKINFRKVD